MSTNETSPRTVTPEDSAVADDYLIRLGLGALRPETVRSTLGRNNNWLGTTESGHAVFVKQLRGPDRAERLRRIVAASAIADDRLRMPDILGADEIDSIVVFVLLPEATSCLDLADNESFSVDNSAACARLVAAFHNGAARDFDTTRHPLPPVELFDAIPFDAYTISSGAQLEMWRLYQEDRELGQALADLRARERVALSSPCPTHGDLRLDHFIMSENEMFVIDFEEARAGDPARDVGTFVGEWLYQAVAKIPEKLPSIVEFGTEATHQEIISTGLSELERREFLVREFCSAYVAQRSEVDDEFHTRCAAYAGWHMLDRMLASTANAATLNPVAKAAAGIGRTLLISPGDFTTTIGVE
jgi:thiamine kinase-like enzyme